MSVPKRRSLSSFQIILIGFFLVILIGAVLLALPVSDKGGHGTPFLDALFTATSALCVTGLVVRDTATYWSRFGKSIILVLIQIGGLGVVTIATVFTTLAGKKIGLRQRSVLQDSIAAPQLGGIMLYLRFIITATLVTEATGALLLLPVFAGEYGMMKGIAFSVFHAISAFCNAGFDLTGEKAVFSSLTYYRASIPVNIVIMLLIIIGGIGFQTLDDIWTNWYQIHRYRLQSKLILVTSAVLIIFPAIVFYCFEFAGLPSNERILSALFQSVTTRTAGFNTADYAKMSETGQLMTILLMLVGGSPGSTAGGVKTTTLAVMLLSAAAVFRQRDKGIAFGRSIPGETVRSAAAILTVYLTLFLTTSAIISRVERMALVTTMFETASAIGTVGLTLGVTPCLGRVSKCLLIVLMYFGRVGGLTLIFAAMPSTGKSFARFPEETVSVG